MQAAAGGNCSCSCKLLYCFDLHGVQIGMGIRSHEINLLPNINIRPPTDGTMRWRIIRSSHRSPRARRQRSHRPRSHRSPRARRQRSHRERREDGWRGGAMILRDVGGPGRGSGFIQHYDDDTAGYSNDSLGHESVPGPPADNPSNGSSRIRSVGLSGRARARRRRTYYRLLTQTQPDSDSEP